MYAAFFVVWLWGVMATVFITPMYVPLGGGLHVGKRLPGSLCLSWFVVWLCADFVCVGCAMLHLGFLLDIATLVWELPM